MSSTICILDELTTALAAPTPAQMQELADLGVPQATTIMVGAAKIRPSDSLYEPDLDGEPAWVIPCIDGGNTVDLLAFKCDEPGRWWLRLGLAAYVGGDALGDAVLDEPVRVFRTPLSWLRAGAPADGLVVVDDDIARRELALFRIAPEDLAHGLELDRVLTIPAQRPRVCVPARTAT